MKHDSVYVITGGTNGVPHHSIAAQTRVFHVTLTCPCCDAVCFTYLLCLRERVFVNMSAFPCVCERVCLCERVCWSERGCVSVCMCVSVCVRQLLVFQRCSWSSLPGKATSLGMS